MSGSIPKDFITEIVDMTDIVSLVESYLPLKKKGKDHFGQCPFCDDGKNPSFSVSDQKQFYYCFKCRATGNVIGFLQSHQGYDFIESIEALAARAGVEVPYENHQSFTSEKDPLYAALKMAMEIFEKNLTDSKDSEHVRNYILNNRKISSEVCRKFSLGYASNSWDALSEEMLNRGIKEEVLIKAGLSKKNKDDKLFDFFRDRLMFPIKDRKGRVVGFGGRVMNAADQPKYLNTGETQVFQKNRELYGFYEALEFRKDLNEIFVVEGYMDSIAMYEHGMTNSVATLGIATNRFHIQKLLQIVNEIIFCFDGDDAGRGAAWGALKNVLPAVTDGKTIKFLFLPEGEDPASLLEKNSPEEFKTKSNNATLLSEYFIDRLTMASEVTSLEQKASLASKAMELLSGMQESSIKKLLEGEVSKVTGLEIKDIKTHSKKISYPGRQIKNPTADLGEDKIIYDSTLLGSKILSLVLTYPYLANQINDHKKFSDFHEPEVQLMIAVVSFFKENPDAGISDLLSTLDKESASFIGALISTHDAIDEQNAMDYLNDCISRLKQSDSITRIIELKEIFETGKLSEDETFELQQHLLSNLHRLEEPEKNLLKTLSQKAN
ncbi:MAG: DNA primase [Pseudomonadota bacterium]|nr:DNA primase [Pseudomonadota bacterium]